MEGSAYYNEHDPFAAAWLRELMKDGLIAPGEVDERDIQDVTPDDLRPFRQVHLFAGIGIWSAALRGAGWSDDRPVLTVSCPCQPFSAAGKGGGFTDERHLWPAAFHIISELGAPVVFGEQVASADGRTWLDLVSSDMEAAAYTGGAFDLCSAGFGAPNIRQRLFFVWMGDREGSERKWSWSARSRRGRPSDGGSAIWLDDAASARSIAAREGPEGEAWNEARLCGPECGLGTGGMADSERSGRQQQPSGGPEDLLNEEDQGRLLKSGDYGPSPSGVANADEPRSQGRAGVPERSDQCAARPSSVAERPGPVNGFWRDADWIGCTDGKWRPVRPGTFPLASGYPNRVGLLRGSGNSLNKEVAQGFIGAVRELIG